MPAIRRPIEPNAQLPVKSSHLKRCNLLSLGTLNANQAHLPAPYWQFAECRQVACIATAFRLRSFRSMKFIEAFRSSEALNLKTCSPKGTWKVVKSLDKPFKPLKKLKQFNCSDRDRLLSAGRCRTAPLWPPDFTRVQSLPIARLIASSMQFWCSLP